MWSAWAKSPFIVTDPGVREAGIVDHVIQSIIDRGIAPDVFDNISANPRDHECVRGSRGGARIRR